MNTQLVSGNNKDKDELTVFLDRLAKAIKLIPQFDKLLVNSNFRKSILDIKVSHDETFLGDKNIKTVYILKHEIMDTITSIDVKFYIDDENGIHAIVIADIGTLYHVVLGWDFEIYDKINADMIFETMFEKMEVCNHIFNGFTSDTLLARFNYDIPFFKLINKVRVINDMESVDVVVSGVMNLVNSTDYVLEKEYVQNLKHFNLIRNKYNKLKSSLTLTSYTDDNINKYTVNTKSFTYTVTVSKVDNVILNITISKIDQDDLVFDSSSEDVHWLDNDSIENVYNDLNKQLKKLNKFKDLYSSFSADLDAVRAHHEKINNNSETNEIVNKLITATHIHLKTDDSESLMVSDSTVDIDSDEKSNDIILSYLTARPDQKYNNNSVVAKVINLSESILTLLKSDDALDFNVPDESLLHFISHREPNAFTITQEVDGGKLLLLFTFDENGTFKMKQTSYRGFQPDSRTDNRSELYKKVSDVYITQHLSNILTELESYVKPENNTHDTDR